MSIPITEMRNAKSITADNTFMDVEINHPQYGWIPYSLNPNDTDMTIDNDDLMVLIGTDFAAYVAPTQKELDAVLAESIRRERASILTEILDPLVSNPLRWAGLTSSQQTEWTTYRTALLDIPEQSGFPNTISWPTAPE